MSIQSDSCWLLTQANESCYMQGCGRTRMHKSHPRMGRVRAATTARTHHCGNSQCTE